MFGIEVCGAPEAKPSIFPFLMPEPMSQQIGDKRKATEELEKSDDKQLKLEESKSLDDATQTENNSKQPEKHMYFEPRKLSDVEIVYWGVTFHCHKFALISQCKYFETAFSDDPQAKRIEIPTLKSVLYVEPIGTAGFHHFLCIVHNMWLAVPLMLEIVGFLSHYFHAEQIEKMLQDRCKRSPISTFLSQVAVAEHYKWPDREFYKTKVVENFTYFVNNLNALKREWTMIPTEAQRDIFAMYINKLNLTIKIPKEMLTS